MSTPISPVIEGLEPYQIVFGKDQEGVMPLPTLRTPAGIVISRWELSEYEKDQLAKGGSVFLFQHTGFFPPMPIDVQIGGHRADNDVMIENYGLNRELIARLETGTSLDSPDLLVIKVPTLLDQPTKFLSSDIYFKVLTGLKTEWSLRSPEQAEMDFDEWLVAEIVRLRNLATHLAINL